MPVNLVTPNDIVTFALKAVGVLGVGQSALAEDYQDSFAALNAMLGLWNRNRWLIWHLVDVSVLSTGAQSYTIGPGCDFNIARPDRLEAAFFRQIVSSQPNQIDYPLQILQAREDYNLIALKTLVSWPTYIFYDAAFPVGRVYPWPVPQAAVYSIHLSLTETLTQFTSYVQTINLPPEYFETLWTNLAVRLAAIYPGSAVSQPIVDLAKGSIEVLRMANAQIPNLRMPAGLSRPALYNIFSDQTY